MRAKLLISLTLVVVWFNTSSQINHRIYATYFGGDGDYSLSATVFDEAGNYYICGSTSSPTLPTDNNSFQSVIGSYTATDCFLAKFNLDNTLSWCTYIGGSGNEHIYDMIIKEDALYICGQSYSSNFPTTVSGNHIPDNFYLDGFVGKMSLDGDMQWLRLYGSSYTDVLKGIEVYDGKIFCTGYSSSTDNLVTADAWQTEMAGDRDGILMVLSATGDVEYCTYIGGDGGEELKNIKIDQEGNIYLGGFTSSSNLPTAENVSYPMPLGGYDACLVKLDSNYQFLWGTYFGGSLSDTFYDMILSSAGTIWMVGDAESTDLPMGDSQLTPNNAQFNNLAGYVAEFSPDGQLIWCSDIRNTLQTLTSSIVGYNGRIAVAGFTWGNFLPTSSNAYLSSNAGHQDAYIMLISSEHNLDYCTYYGGDVLDSPNKLAAHGSKLIIAGSTSSTYGLATIDGYDQIGGSQLTPAKLFMAIFDFDITSGITQIDNSDLLIYPNPTSSVLNISNNQSFSHLILYDAQGKIVLLDNSVQTTRTMDISNLPAGLYQLQVRTHTGIESRKVLIE